MDVTTLFTILLLFAATCLCIALIIYLRKITKSFNEIRLDVKDLSSQLKPLIVSTTELSERLKTLSEDVREPVQTAKSIVSDIKDRVDTILELEEKLRGGFEGSVSGLIRNLSALANGVNTFWNTFRKNNS
ncbi:MAG: hypothetical protein A2057_08405 [Ignavibacteria bacterium GWA2_35_9]|nr:MAG: hypothetical protein A2057_08405 [Ignavibacteria bacterium GWA2_35_9]OGU46114.1 MAG: hypothetical protein A2000_11840 [Ignavibacteria bacterium GWB2_36_8]OGU53209.1 MAG: hypothetical protein A2080_07835 [Ignavibacteria bacterium GWC2_36_12]OGV02847.1 MAG: hypothetical protein A2330_06830 [Ignavibacteria bacterium RIFOXYB2_FULL_36_7]